MDHVAFTGPPFGGVDATIKKERRKPYARPLDKTLVEKIKPTKDVVVFKVGSAYKENTLHFFLQDVQRFAARGGGPCTLLEKGTSLTVVWDGSLEKGVEERFFGKLISEARFIALIEAERIEGEKSQNITLFLASVSYSTSRHTLREISEEERQFRILQCIHFADKMFYAWLNAEALASYENLHWLCLPSGDIVTFKKIIGNSDEKNRFLKTLAKCMLLEYIGYNEGVPREPNGTQYTCWTFHGKTPSDYEILQVVYGDDAVEAVLKTKSRSDVQSESKMIHGLHADNQLSRPHGGVSYASKVKGPSTHAVFFHVGEAYKKQTMHFFLLDVGRFAVKPSGLCTFQNFGSTLTVKWNSSLEQTVEEAFFGKMISDATFLNLIDAKYFNKDQDTIFFTISLQQQEAMDRVPEEDFRILQCIHFAGALFYAWFDPQAEASFSNLHWLCLTTYECTIYETGIYNPQKCTLQKLARFTLWTYIKKKFDRDYVNLDGIRSYCWTIHELQEPFQEGNRKVVHGAAEALSRVPDAPFAAADDPLQDIWHAADDSAVFHGALPGSSELLAGLHDVSPMQWGTLSASPGVPALANGGDLTHFTGMPADGDLSDFHGMPADGDLSDFHGMSAHGDLSHFTVMPADDSFLSEVHDNSSEWEWLKH